MKFNSMENIYIIGEINEQTVEKFCADLNDYNGGNLNILIDSNGGYVDAAFVIADIINDLKSLGNITIQNIGNVCSCATIIWLSANKRVWNENYSFLIHNPYVEMVTGDAETMIEYAIELQKTEDAIIDVYKTVSGKSEQEIFDRMQPETPLSVEELIDYKFITHRLVTKRKYNKL